MSPPRLLHPNRSIRFLFENSLFLVAGAIIGLIWANWNPEGYEYLLNLGGGGAEADAGHHITLKHFVDELLMAFFFAIAAKEVWEAMLPGGALSNPRKAATPLLATLGGMVGPAGIYIVGVAVFGQFEALKEGWAIPCATDIAFSYMVARIIFGPGHPAIPFLLLLAIADDAGGLIIIAVFYPRGDVHLLWLLLTAAAVLVSFGLHRLRFNSFWWYLLIPGVMSWVSFYKAGIHPALGLVPIVPAMPHAHTDLGIFVREELGRHDTLNAFEHWWKNPVELILGLFGLVNAGVVFSNVGLATGTVLTGLVIGKPLGITLFTWLGQKVFRLQVPGGMGYREILVVGTVAGIGFTVALFVSSAAFEKPGVPREFLDAAKMGALASFFVAVIAFVLARALGVRRYDPANTDPDPPAPPGAPPI